MRCASSVRRACGRELEPRGIPFFYQQFRNTMFRKGAVSPWMADMRRLRPFFHNKQRECPKVLIPGQRHAARTMHSAISLPDAAGCHAALESAASKKPSAISGKGRSLRGTTFVYHSLIPSVLLSLRYLGRTLTASAQIRG